MRVKGLTPPVPITEAHDLKSFASGVPSLDEWLRKRALKNEAALASRTYVTCSAQRVVGYYCLCAGVIALRDAPRKMTRNMPDPIPVMVLGRLAIDQSYQNQGVGKALLLDAVHRSARAAGIVGASALLVHALSSEARRFYLAQGFVESPIQPMTLCLRLIDVLAVLNAR